MTRLLLVQTAQLGDLILTTPLLRALRELAGEASITVISDRRGAALFERLPEVDRVVAFGKHDSARERSNNDVVRQLASEEFDVGIAAHRSLRSAKFLWLIGAARRIGFGDALGRWFYTDRVPLRRERHAARRYLELIAPLGGDPEAADPQPRVPVPKEAVSSIEQLLERHGVPRDAEILAISPGAAWRTKRWSTDGFARTAEAAAGWGLRPVLVGASGERGLCDAVASGCRVELPNVAGDTDVWELAALLRRSRALVGNDSGAAHVASAVGTPAVTVFGPTLPEFGFTAFGSGHHTVERGDLACRPCDRHGPPRCPLGHHRCMTGIRPQQVIRALESVLVGGAA